MDSASVRASEEYKNMTIFRSIEIIEGLKAEDLSDLQIMAAWHFMYDNGHLQGWYGRICADLVEEGKITPLTN